MNTHTMGLFEAKTRLSEMVARAERGEEVIITRHNKPVAKLVSVASTTGFDAARRREAVAQIEALRESLRRQYGSMTSQEIVDLVRESRDERDEQIWRAVKR